ncbi:MAG: hypothetical protein GY947_11965, partial [Rhodobacteraceae bacterium]|nr:hypothetical protein [Paracoccaceae bacterium]
MATASGGALALAAATKLSGLGVRSALAQSAKADEFIDHDALGLAQLIKS